MQYKHRTAKDVLRILYFYTGAGRCCSLIFVNFLTLTQCTVCSIYLLFNFFVKLNLSQNTEMDPSINSIVNARRRFASVMHLYPRSGESQQALPIDRFDQIMCTTYETIVDVHRFPFEQIQICIDKAAGKLIVCGYREGDIPQFGFKSDFFKELDIPLGVDVDNITATYNESGYVHFSLPCTQQKKIGGREMNITQVGLRSSAGPTLSSSSARKNIRNRCTAPVLLSNEVPSPEAVPVKSHKNESPSESKNSPRQLFYAKSTGNLDAFDTNRTIWDKPYTKGVTEKRSVPLKHQLSSASFANRNQQQPIQNTPNSNKCNFEQQTSAPVKTSEVQVRKESKPNVSECVKSIELKSCESFSQSDYSLESIKIVESTEPKKVEHFNSIKKHTDMLAANLDSFKKEMKEANDRIEHLYKMAGKSANESTATKNKSEGSFGHADRGTLKHFGKNTEHFVPVEVTNEYFYRIEDSNQSSFSSTDTKSTDASKVSGRKNERIIPIEIESPKKPAKNVKYNSTVYIEEENYETEI